MRTSAAALIAVLVTGAMPALATETGYLKAVTEFVAAIQADAVCVIASADSPQRAKAIIWSSEEDEKGGAAVWHDVRSKGTIKPCWAAPGHCALLKGPLPIRTDACLEATRNDTLGAFKKKMTDNVYSTSAAEQIPNVLAAFALLATQIAEGLRGDEHTVRLIGGSPVYISEGGDDELRLRIVLPGGDLDIERLRVSVRTLKVSTLERAATALGTRTLRLVGLNGALVHDDGYRIFANGSCTRLVTPEKMQHRLNAAGTKFKLGTVPRDAEAAAKAFDDIVQLMLGGVVKHGRAVEIQLDQRPEIFLAAPSGERRC